MRFMMFFLMLAFLLIGRATTQAADDGPTIEEPPADVNCDAHSQRLTSLGKPSADSILLAPSDTNAPLTPTPSGGELLPSPGSEPSASSQSTDGSTNGTTQMTYAIDYGDTLSKIAVRFDTSVYELIDANRLRHPNLLRLGQQLIIPQANQDAHTAFDLPVREFSPPFEAVWIEGEAVQGEAVLLWLRVAEDTTVRGQLDNQSIAFRDHCGLLWGLVAFDALHDEPGIYTLNLEAVSNEEKTTMITVPIELKAGNFWSGSPIIFPRQKQDLLKPEVIASENAYLTNIFTNLPDELPYWQGPFQVPRNSTITAGFGSRGVVDGVPISYHEGIDYRGFKGTPFHAPAPGRVIIAEALTVRGNTIYIDHGAGVVSGYFHMSEMNLAVGDSVALGDVVGKIGDTGLTTGPHLHWEIRVNGRTVNPNTWLRRDIPVPAQEVGAEDWAIPYGRFYSQTVDGNDGFRVVDDRNARFFSHFLRLGGLQIIGYPISQRYQEDGFLTQAFQKQILQWRPEVGEAWPKNVFDDLSKRGYDQLLRTRQIPLSLPPNFDRPNAPWREVMNTRWALLGGNEAIRNHYFSVDDSLNAFGLPTSYVEDMGNHYALRTQRAVFQQWKEEMPWAEGGEVTIANGGDISKELRLLPYWAIQPERMPER